MEDGLTPPLIFAHKKGLTKLELKVHVIQSLIKPLLILHETSFLVPPFIIRAANSLSVWYSSFGSGSFPSNTPFREIRQGICVLHFSSL